jgi:hypothetical protein
MALGKPVPSSSALGVFCLESWSGDLRNRETVRPLLELLADQAGLRFIHRIVDSRAQLLNYVIRWQSLNGYRVCYVACHGSNGVIHVGGDTIPLTDLGDELAEQRVDLANRTLYLGSCSVMGTKRTAVTEFREKTGLGCVCGYAGERGVDWLESAAFELLLFQALAFSRYAQDRFALRDLVAQHRQLARHLDFKFDPPTPATRGGRA